MNPQPLPPYYPYGFPVSGEAWRRFLFVELPAATGSPTKGETLLAAQMLTARLSGYMSSEKPPRTGEILAMGLLTESLRAIAVHYCTALAPRALEAGLEAAAAALPVRDVLNDVVSLFPPTAVHAGLLAPWAVLGQPSGPMGGPSRVAIETLLIAVANENTAMRPYAILHADNALRARGDYAAFVALLDRYFATLPPHPHTKLTLMAMLRAPMRAAPDSLEGQLDYIRERWAALLSESLLEQLVLARGVLREETQFRGHGPGPVEVMQFPAPGANDYVEFEAFSQDSDWMPNVVLIAKQTYVWLDQLSRKYARPIHRLDQVPDEELDQLARWGFSGLWLIGLWERSAASRDIKRRMGNPEAEASAYSLYDYTIAHDLGGERAYSDLAARAGRRGVRLASDMVPNHVGIYSRWVIEHPQWFLQSHEPPFPTYTFNGPDLSYDDTVGLYIEDGYWEKRDAAVVFKRLDKRTGEVRYLYHGNDGTNMPWNDTAQLDFLNPEVRESVIRTVIHVARMFPIIRFDAAMTLAKKHYQRLWFPKPGDEGAIPSRAAHGMSREEFDQSIPQEFWREVVDRVAAEAPDTLLLAEAFWLMEGYFVRTLGMHRVYNSAFMNMLKTEKNAEYRLTIKNVLEFSPEILQRFVNFMNNPDEDTAEAQFGKGDKYFGVATLMATLPGLPMFGHGQIEGYTEKYGMEYRRAYKDETPEGHLVWRHEREIFPLLHHRRIFSGAKNFALFDFYAPEGHVDEDVFAYSNRHGDERALVIYNNAHKATRGWVRVSSAINEGSADEPRLRQRDLAESLALHAADTAYYIVCDHTSGLEYLHHSRDLCARGLHVELGPYQCRVYLDWRVQHDHDLSWGALHGLLQGRGVPSMADAYKEMHLRDVLDPFDAMMKPDTLRGLLLMDDATENERKGFATARDAFYRAAFARLGRALPGVEESAPVKRVARKGSKPAPLDNDYAPVLSALLRPLGEDSGVQAAAIARDWMLGKHLAEGLQAYGVEAVAAADSARLAILMLEVPDRLHALGRDVWGPVLHAFFENPEARAFLRVHYFGGKRWLNREQLEILCRAVLVAPDSAAVSLAEARDVAQTLQDAAADCSYDFDAMLSVLK